MRVFLKGLFVLLCGFVAFLLAALPGLVTNHEYPDAALWLMFASPVLGSMAGAWLVSRRSTRDGRLGWILGGGLGLGLLSAAMIVVAGIALLLQISSFTT